MANVRRCAENERGDVFRDHKLGVKAGCLCRRSASA